jgi:hypothetical protein
MQKPKLVNEKDIEAGSTEQKDYTQSRTRGR